MRLRWPKATYRNSQPRLSMFMDGKCMYRGLTLRSLCRMG